MSIINGGWTEQYFAGVDCPDHVTIPTSDPDAWLRYPAERHIYDKLAVALGQGLRAAPYGIPPDGYPVFSKPVMNLHGMGAGSAILYDEADYDRYCTPGHFWVELLSGEHVSSDVALVEGEPKWWRHATGVPAGRGMFDHWVVHAEKRLDIELRCGSWIARHLSRFTGMVNLETIGGKIIDAHLRLTDQWPDLYGGRAWVEAVIGLYAERHWRLDDRARRTGYSVALFGPKGQTYRHPPNALREYVLGENGITSLQITFYEDRPSEWHSNPPGGFRLAVINGTSLRACLRARQRLADHFGAAPVNQAAVSNIC
jgi:hypothetical protein